MVIIKSVVVVMQIVVISSLSLLLVRLGTVGHESKTFRDGEKGRNVLGGWVRLLDRFPTDNVYSQSVDKIRSRVPMGAVTLLPAPVLRSALAPIFLGNGGCTTLEGRGTGGRSQ